MNIVLQKRRNSTLGAIDWNAIISAIGQGISIGVGQSMSRQQAEAARGQLQTEALSVLYNQIYPATQNCQINGVAETEALINRFNQACTSLPHASVAASCANIVNEQRRVWLPFVQGLGAACQNQTPVQNPTPAATQDDPASQNQTPVYNQAGQIIGYQPVRAFDLTNNSNTLPLILLAVGVVILVTR